MNILLAQLWNQLFISHLLILLLAPYPARWQSCGGRWPAVLSVCSGVISFTAQAATELRDRQKYAALQIMKKFSDFQKNLVFDGGFRVVTCRRGYHIDHPPSLSQSGNETLNFSQPPTFQWLLLSSRTSIPVAIPAGKSEVLVIFILQSLVYHGKLLLI